MMNATKTMHLGAMIMVGFLIAACNAGNGTADNDAAGQAAVAGKSAKEIVMYKSPGCACCTGWAEHMRKAGFTVIENKRDDMSGIKSKYGVTEKLASCHTAIVDGYVIEGHVPAVDVERLLKERPANVAGLTAPGMPMKSPGMQGKDLPPKNYNVLAFDKDGKSRVFKRY